jgi:putative heme-binding domain-containing protein
MAEKKLPRDELNAFHARQIRSLQSPDLLRKLSDVWGEVKESSEEKKKLLVEYKERFDRASLGRADLELGRQTYKAVCGNCHTLLGEGGKIGPDLTGGNRRNLDYLLENIVDPNAIVPEAYRISIIETEDGRILTGVILEKSSNAFLLQTSLEKISVPRTDVAAIKESPNSLMPEGILTALTDQQAKALLAFLMQ